MPGPPLATSAVQPGILRHSSVQLPHGAAAAAAAAALRLNQGPYYTGLPAEIGELFTGCYSRRGRVFLYVKPFIFKMDLRAYL